HIYSNSLAKNQSKSNMAIDQSTSYDLYCELQTILGYDNLMKIENELGFPGIEMISTPVIKDKHSRDIKLSRLLIKRFKEKEKDISNLFSRIGKHWSAEANKDNSSIIELYCSPKSFSLIGHYGPDSTSCFSQQHENEYHKLNFATTNNSFVSIMKL